MFRKLIGALMAVAITLVGTVPVFAQAPAAPANSGYVFLMSNAPSGNQVIEYTRAANGSLALVGSFDTGGTGSGIGQTVPPDPLGSQNSIIVTSNGKWVFAVNAGSNDISALRVTSAGLVLKDRVSSGGSYPVSLTYKDDILYVLNAGGDGSISGFVFDDNHLTPLAGSTRSLHAATPNNGSQPNILEAPAQVAFSPDGDFLVVTDKGGVSGAGRILVFKVNNNGKPSVQPAVTQTAHPVPFAFTFDRYGHLVVVDASAGTVTSYDIRSNGSLAILDTALTGQAATCWIAPGLGGRYIFTDNTGSGSLSGFAASTSGQLTPLTANSVVAVTGAGTLPLDMGSSRDGSFVYSLETGAGKIGAFQVNSNGSLTSLGTLGSYPAVGGYQGIAVY